MEELIEILRNMYRTAPAGERATSVHLFGIKHAEELAGVPVDEVVVRAGLTRSWGTEIRKGMKLARYVDLKH